LRRSSRETVDGDRPSRLATARIGSPRPAAAAGFALTSHDAPAIEPT